MEQRELAGIEDTVDISAVAAVHRRRVQPAEGLRHILRNRSGVQSAVLLSEILAPPLALRDNPKS